MGNTETASVPQGAHLLSSNTVKPGAKLTISGLAYARAGLNVTILSRAISSARTVNGLPAVQTPALAEGI